MSEGHAIVDGSNIATEGRTTPSLAQLDEAITTFIEEHDFEHVTVIVDASFEHRVEKHETEAARVAIEDGEIITPPAGVIGRGDAFILQVADRADAVVLSNDSFQEFHGTYDWLFDHGRLIGGKPIPDLGWIFVPRVPVRGPISRRAVRDSSSVEPAPEKPAKTSRRTSKKAAAKKTTAKKTVAKKATTKKPATRKASAAKSKTPRTSKAHKTDKKPIKASGRRSKGDGNTTKSWKRFRSDYPEGSTVAAVVDRFSSHGAYGMVDKVAVYIPLRLLGDPAPRRARDVVALGETHDFIVHSFDEARLGIDVGLVAYDSPAPAADKESSKATSTTKSRAKPKPAPKTRVKGKVSKSIRKAVGKKISSKKIR